MEKNRFYLESGDLYARIKKAVAICDRLRNLNVENNSWF